MNGHIFEEYYIFPPDIGGYLLLCSRCKCAGQVSNATARSNTHRYEIFPNGFDANTFITNWSLMPSQVATLKNLPHCDEILLEKLLK